MLADMVGNGLLEARALVAFYPAGRLDCTLPSSRRRLLCQCSDGDDIVLFKDQARKEAAGKLHSLRQQAEKEVGAIAAVLERVLQPLAQDLDAKYLALSDFVAPVSSGVEDYVGECLVRAWLCVAQLQVDRNVCDVDLWR